MVTSLIFRLRYYIVTGEMCLAKPVLSREEKGRLIAESGSQILAMDERSFRVASQSRDICYDVIRRENGSWICNCFDHYYRQVRCKHIIACQIREQLREKVRENIVIRPVEITACIYCQCVELKRFGIRHNKYGDIQRFLCVGCERTFSVNIGFERMKHSPQGVTTAMQLYFSGESLRNTARSLRLLGVQVSYKTVFMWIKKYTALMQNYANQITPNVSDTWRADELFLKVKGNMKYLYALMDDQTRYWIAQEVADTKYTADVRSLFQHGKQLAGKQPKTLITDGAPNFHEAYKKEFWAGPAGTEHIREVHIDGQVHNNKMERFNGQLRDRERYLTRGNVKLSVDRFPCEIPVDESATFLLQDTVGETTRGL